MSTYEATQRTLRRCEREIVEMVAKAMPEGMLEADVIAHLCAVPMSDTIARGMVLGRIQAKEIHRWGDRLCLGAEPPVTDADAPSHDMAAFEKIVRDAVTIIQGAGLHLSGQDGASLTLREQRGRPEFVVGVETNCNLMNAIIGAHVMRHGPVSRQKPDAFSWYMHIELLERLYSFPKFLWDAVDAGWYQRDPNYLDQRSRSERRSVLIANKLGRELRRECDWVHPKSVLARKQAAAAEMFEALEAAEYALDRVCIADRLDDLKRLEALETVRAALAKATGSAS